MGGGSCLALCGRRHRVCFRAWALLGQRASVSMWAEAAAQAGTGSALEASQYTLGRDLEIPMRVALEVPLSPSAATRRHCSSVPSVPCPGAGARLLRETTLGGWAPCPIGAE